jgi:hypothetical protein
MKKQKRIRSHISYSGNALYNLHPADVFTDPRFPRNRFQEGEFAAIKITLSTNQLKEGKARGQFINIDRLAKVRPTSGEFNQELAQTPDLERPDVDKLTSDMQGVKSDVFKMIEFHVNLIPRDWQVGKGDLPERWVFTVDENFETIIEARPLGALHNKFPLALIEVEPEGYMLFSRSLIEIYGPLQNTLDWLVNSHFFNVRQTLNNQFIFDPSKVMESDITRKTPGKAIRLKPAAYGTDVRMALTQLPVQDVTAAHFNDMNMLYELGQRLGVSDSIMGVETPASRRTAQEVRGSQAFAVGRLKTMAEYFSATGFSDLGGMLVSNSQQYYDSTMKLRIAGESAAALAGPKFLNVSPEDIAGEYFFAPVDGTLPIDRYAQANLWREILIQMKDVPQVIAQYDLGKIFGYIAQLAGLKNLDRFKIQVMPDQMMMAQAQQGNAVPMVPQPGANMLEPGQVPGMGPTA